MCGNFGRKEGWGQGCAKERRKVTKQCAVNAVIYAEVIAVGGFSCLALMACCPSDFI